MKSRQKLILTIMKKQLLLFLFAIVASVGTMFASTKIGDLYYNLNATNKTAEVTYKSYANYRYNEGWNITTADIPASVTYSGTTYSVTSIGSYAFESCSGLTSVTIPNSVTSIGYRAFYYCSSLTSVTIPNSVTSIANNAFHGCSSLTSVTIPNSVTSIRYGAFHGCSSLTSVTIPNSVTSIGDYAFYRCSSLTSVTIPNSVTSIGDYAFESCSSLTSVTIPNSVTSIGEEAFRDCSSLTSVIIPNSVTSIGEEAFRDCSSLTSVTIPNSVTSIGSSAFSGCSSLTAIYVPCGEMERFKQMLNNDSRIIDHAPLPYTITINAINGTVAYPQTTCDDMQLTATPYNGYHFVKWSDGNTDNPRTIELTCDTIFTALFEHIQCTLSLQCDENQGTVEGAGVFDYLAEVQISATPAYGYHFSSWSDGNTANPRTYTITKDITLTANFALNKYALNVSCNAEQGSVTGSGSYNYLSNRTIEAIPNYGYHFAKWNDGNTDNPRTFVLTKDTTFTAQFAPNQYTLSLQCDENQGTVEGAGVFDYLTEVQISATPAYGYHFSSWSDGNTDNPRTYSVTKDVTLTANFAINKYALNVSCNAEQGSVSGSGSYNYLSNRTIEAIPNYGYHFAQWSDGNKENPRTIVMTQDTAFAAEFAVDKSGVCGDDNLLTWTFEDESKTLAISGEGTLNSNYTFGVEAPTQTERLIIAEGVTSVGNNAFKDMSSTITSLALPSTVTEIGDYAFAGMNSRKFNTLVLPNTIIRIGAHAFDGASYLQTIHFGSTLEEIGDYAFNGCTRVKQMTCLAEITPNVGTDGLTSINSLAELYVPNEYLFDYQIDSNWSRFVLKPYGATETTVTDNDVAVVADDNTATFTWPTSNTADSYTIDITKDGVLFCQLTFNANGQLTGIAFAPGRDGQSMAPAATLTTSGMQFTVTGLNSGTNYAFNLTVKSGSTVVASYTGAFATTGGVPTSTDVQQSDLAPRKFIRDNQVLILRDGKTYTIQGVEVK